MGIKGEFRSGPFPSPWEPPPEGKTVVSTLARSSDDDPELSVSWSEPLELEPEESEPEDENAPVTWKEVAQMVVLCPLALVGSCVAVQYLRAWAGF